MIRGVSVTADRAGTNLGARTVLIAVRVLSFKRFPSRFCQVPPSTGR